MNPKSSRPRSTAGRVPAATVPPFTRLEHNVRATVEQFEREHMGIAAKE